MASYLETPLGKVCNITVGPERSTLCPIPRSLSALRSHSRFKDLPIQGEDVWNCYEFSWLNENLTPQTAICRIRYDCNSPSMVESKSLKLYLASFYNTVFASQAVAERRIYEDLCGVLQGECSVILYSPKDWQEYKILDIESSAFCLDSLSASAQTPFGATVLRLESEDLCHEHVYTNAFRSICPVTAQPDWATVNLKYYGKRLERKSIFEYLLSFREHGGFHEEVCEQIFADIFEIGAPSQLLVSCNFLRRGGIDINPIRYSSVYAGKKEIFRTIRQ